MKKLCNTAENFIWLFTTGFDADITKITGSPPCD
jgi:hypothetical protein